MTRQLSTTELSANFGEEQSGHSGIFELSEINLDGINSAKFDGIVTFFEKKGVPATLARTYGASLLEASTRTGIDITDLVNINENNELTFSDEALEHLNHFRSKTSQIGYNIHQDIINENIKRAIFV